MIPSQVRCFWAVCPPDESCEQVGQLVRQLKRPLAGLGLQVAWTPRESYHLTLKFLGEVAEGELGTMVAAVQRQLAGRPPAVPQLGLMGLGVFPGPQRPHVLYVEARAGADDRHDPAAPTGPAATLHTLHELIEEGLAPLGYAREERAFRPHLTIGRVRDSSREAELQTALPELLTHHATHRHGPAFPAETLILYESQPTPSGPKYTPIARLPLTAARAGSRSPSPNS